MSNSATATATAVPGLPLHQLEHTYDALAEAIDRAPAGKSELMLVKLALLLAQELGDGPRVAELMELALRDL
jgi:hypothetical protein